MPRDPGLEALLADDLRDVKGIAGKAMFGGWALLLNGNLLCGIRTESVLVRLGPGNDAWALKRKGIATAIMGGRPMHGWVRASREAYENDALRQKLLQASVTFVQSLPGK